MHIGRKQQPGYFGWFLAVGVCVGWAGLAIAAVDFTKSTGNKVYNDGKGHTMPYRLFVPAGYNTPGAEFPLVLFMHGAGERGSDNSLQCTGGGHLNNLFDATQGKAGAQYKSFLLVPQVASGAQWVSRDWGLGSYTNAQEPAESLSMKMAMAILDDVIAHYAVDVDRLYVTGLSMGGYGTFDAIRRYPGKFAAAMPLSGGGNKSQGELLKNTPIWAYHGAADSIVPVKGTDDMRTAIQAAGGTMEYTRPNGVGHEGWGTFYDGKTYKNSAGQTLYPWLFAQSVPEPGGIVMAVGTVMGLGRRRRGGD